jgi:hypothetical protein
MKYLITILLLCCYQQSYSQVGKKVGLNISPITDAWASSSVGSYMVLKMDKPFTFDRKYDMPVLFQSEQEQKAVKKESAKGSFLNGHLPGWVLVLARRPWGCLFIP